MVVVPFLALCFSAPVAMGLCLLWLGASGQPDLALRPTEIAILAALTGAISLCLSLLMRLRLRGR